MRIDADGTITPLSGSPIPNFEVPADDELTLAGKILAEPWAQASDLDERVIRVGIRHDRPQARGRGHQAHDPSESTRPTPRPRTPDTGDQLLGPAWLRDSPSRSEPGRKTRLPASQMRERAEVLARRLDRRLKELEQERDISVRPPRVTGACLVVTAGLARCAGQTQKEPLRGHGRPQRSNASLSMPFCAWSMPSVTSATEMHHNNPGYDIESDTPDGPRLHRGQGTRHGGKTFVLTRQEAVTALNKGEHWCSPSSRSQTDDSTTVRYYATRSPSPSIRAQRASSMTGIPSGTTQRR